MNPKPSPFGLGAIVLSIFGIGALHWGHHLRDRADLKVAPAASLSPLRRLLRHAPPEHHWAIVCTYLDVQRRAQRVLQTEDQRRAKAEAQARRAKDRAAELEYLRPVHVQLQRVQALRQALQDVVGFMRSDAR